MYSRGVQLQFTTTWGIWDSVEYSTWKYLICARENQESPHEWQTMLEFTECEIGDKKA